MAPLPSSSVELPPLRGFFTSSRWRRKAGERACCWFGGRGRSGLAGFGSEGLPQPLCLYSYLQLLLEAWTQSRLWSRQLRSSDPSISQVTGSHHNAPWQCPLVRSSPVRSIRSQPQVLSIVLVHVNVFVVNSVNVFLVSSADVFVANVSGGGYRELTMPPFLHSFPFQVGVSSILSTSIFNSSPGSILLSVQLFFLLHLLSSRGSQRGRKDTPVPFLEL